jgi:MoxR-like ATPase
MVDTNLPRSLYIRVKNEVSKVLVGKEDLVRLAVIALLTDGHILLEGIPGVAKTLFAKAFSKSLGLSFKRIQFTPDMLPSDVTGTFVFDQKSREFYFREGPIFSNVILADEINRATPKTQSALLEAMQEMQVTVEGLTKELEKPFVVMATQNPIELEGTYPLPEAQLDRFMFRAIVTIPTHFEEVNVLRKANVGIDINYVQKVVDKDEIFEARKIVQKDVYISNDILEYIVLIVEATREDKEKVILGGSPRASVHLLNASKCYAALDGRDYVLPDDVKSLAFHVLNHRIILNPEFAIKISPHNEPFNYKAIKEVISSAIAKVSAPR